MSLHKLYRSLTAEADVKLLVANSGVNVSEGGMSISLADRESLREDAEAIYSALEEPLQVKIQPTIEHFYARAQLPEPERKLQTQLGGWITKRKKNVVPSREGIVVSVLSVTFSQKQAFFVFVNIYIPYIAQIEDVDELRVEELSKLSLAEFEVFRVGEVRFSVDTQTVLDVPKVSCSVVSNKLLVKLKNS